MAITSTTRHTQSTIYPASLASGLARQDPRRVVTISPPERVRFQGEETPDLEPEAKLTTRQFLKIVARKFRSREEFKRSVQQGYQYGKTDLQKALSSDSKKTVAKRIGMETLSLVVGIAFIPVPGPNLGILISPTARAFIKGFVKETKH